MAAVDLRPLPTRDRPVRRVPQLLAGLVLYAVSMAMQVRAGLGLSPWDVLHEGLTLRTGLSFGAITGIVGVVVLLLWIPLRERPGLGTVANVLVIAVVVDVALRLISTPEPLWARVALMVGGVVANGLATACYVGARLGPGPRDGLMTGLVHRTAWPLRWVRTGIEVSVLALGWLLGGTVGIGTVLYALAVGPLTQAFLPWVVVRERIAG
ncbi:YczE/YyaS/YitT family protein [Pseudonocardia sp. CA-107938]|uniref:membrane protein YczE n=1 Tax=Pseudonocardia sp. CA-107938 TaxID=3240021 RepID=UPI003D90C2FF